MEIHFYESSLMAPADIPIAYGWSETEEAIERKQFKIVTVQIGLLSTRLIEAGYRVFVHPKEGRTYEIRLDDKNDCTDKELRPAHNLFKMWQAGAFR